MPDRADAHIHLFEHGYGPGTVARTPDLDCWLQLMQQHEVSSALVVGYAGEAWTGDNNAYLAGIIQSHESLHATAFFKPSELSISALNRYAAQGFVGVSLYLFDKHSQEELAAIDHDVWAWLADRRWLVSVNAKGSSWLDWLPILEAQPNLRVLISHLGLPSPMAEPPTERDAAHQMAPILALADYPGPHIKFSGLYAITTPSHDYPHHAAHPYLRLAASAFGEGRLLWGSDFPPCLDSVSYPQTFDAIDFIGSHSADAQQKLEGGNLRKLLNEAQRS